MEENDPSARLKVYHEAYAEVSAIARERLGVATPRGFGRGNLALLAHLLKGRDVLEVGCGYGFAVEALAPLVRRIVGTDVVPQMLETAGNRLTSHGVSNFDLVCQPAQQIDFPPNSFDVVFADNVWEHLHPEDAAECARRALTVLRPGGHLIIITVNRRCGPSDISRYFKPRGTVADGLHLFEWGYTELRDQLRFCGFRRQRTFVLPGSQVLAKCGLVKIASRIPVGVTYKTMLESSFVAKSKYLAKALGIQNVLVVAEKDTL